MRKTLSVFLTLTLLLTVFAGSAVAKPGKGQGQGQFKQFKDIKGHWGELSITKMQTKGLLNGYEDGSFRPENTITQAEAAVIIKRLVEKKLNITDDDEDLTNDEEDLTGVPDWAKKAVKKGIKNKYLNLKRFHSQVQCNRLMVSVALAKALGLEPVKYNSINPFKDRNLISDEDYGYLLALYQAGYIKGYPDGNFNPNGLINRAEIACIIERLLGDDVSDDNTAEDTTKPYWSNEYLTASSLTSSSVTLKWAGAHDNYEVTKYRIYKDDVLKYTFDADVNTKTIIGLNEDTEYTFRVEAGDAAGNWSTDGPEIDVTTKESSDTTKPYWENDRLTVTNITQTSVTLEWYGAKDNKAVNKYKIYVNGSLNATINDGNANSKTITGLNAGINYTFKVEAGDEAGNLSTDGPSISVSTQD